MKRVFCLRNLNIRQGEEFSLSVEKLDIETGGIYALVGANGSGKSTFLRTLALLKSPHAGTMTVGDGENVTLRGVRHKWRRRVTMVEQSPYLFDGTVFQNVSYGLKVRKVNAEERRKRAARALKDVGLEGFEDRKTEELSAGEVQRVAIARAVVLRPGLLLLDEPTANIDQQNLQVFELLVRHLVGQGISIVFSTHDHLLMKRLEATVLRVEMGKVFEQEQVHKEKQDDEGKRAYGHQF